MRRFEVLGSNKRRVAYDVGAVGRWKNLFPVNMKRVAVPDMRAMNERYAGACTAEAISRFQIELMIGDPHRHLSNMGRAFVNLYAKKLFNAHADHGADVQQAFALPPFAEKPVDQIQFEAA